MVIPLVVNTKSEGRKEFDQAPLLFRFSYPRNRVKESHSVIVLSKFQLWYLINFSETVCKSNALIDSSTTTIVPRIIQSFISSCRPIIRKGRLSFHRDLTFSDCSPIARVRIEQYYLLTTTIKWKKVLVELNNNKKKNSKIQPAAIWPTNKHLCFSIFIPFHAKYSSKCFNFVVKIRLFRSVWSRMPATLNEERSHALSLYAFVDRSPFEKKKGRDEKDEKINDHHPFDITQKLNLF